MQGHTSVDHLHYQPGIDEFALRWQYVSTLFIKFGRDVQGPKYARDVDVQSLVGKIPASANSGKNNP